VAHSAPMGMRISLAALAAVALLAGCAQQVPVQGRTITLGVGSTEEQRVLAALTIAALDRAGIAVEPRTELGGTRRLRQEARRGTIDLYWDYTGAAWALGLGQQGPPADPRESYERVRDSDAGQGLLWLDPTQANATLALFVRAANRPADGTLTALARELSAGGKRLCADPDFIDRPAGYEALADEYAIRQLIPLRRANEHEAIAAVADGTCLAGLATATAGEAVRAGLVPVTDDQQVFPAFIVAPVARADVLKRLPEIAGALRPITGALTTASLAQLNAQLIGGADPQALAEGFLARSR
jgi:osmoprotectant transport system substrate-binding protein